MAQRFHIKNDVVLECARLRVCCINPGLRRTGRRTLRAMEAQHTRGGDGPIETFKHVIGEKNRQRVCVESRKQRPYFRIEEARSYHSDQAAAPESIQIAV